jgi:hypothetical protein
MSDVSYKTLINSGISAAHRRALKTNFQSPPYPHIPYFLEHVILDVLVKVASQQELIVIWRGLTDLT